MADGDGRGIDRLLSVMRRLRDPRTGCPWDIEQSFATIAPYTIEEAYEVADAIERADWADLEGELGDLLLQVVYHAQMADERGWFDFDAVARAIADKMIARHPHVFGSDEVADSAALMGIWEERKARERAAKAQARGADASVLADVPVALPALTRALKLQKRAARVGFDWGEAAPVLSKLREELDELETALAEAVSKDELALELGDLLFSVVNLARHLQLDPEAALRATNAKFERRFRRIEAAAARQGRPVGSLTLDELEALWQQAKAEERRAAPADDR
ncbi:nucleoside triphosphate pyrophosphohydrolase [Benzoatithermus flavus]|uniref:Nucleoside triphosphate pyrophosphohydrolase n=1 Tax=Benzoatithermus flavus TaxID=3108223 RepID=A0ABU8XUZ2_9PROT